MNLDDILSCLATKWLSYLEGRGHYIYKTTHISNIIRSRNRTKVRYHWLLLVGEGRKRMLNKAEQAQIRKHLSQANKRKEAIYLVVGFLQEPSRIVIIPAKAALKAGHISSEKGGIAWDD